MFSCSRLTVFRLNPWRKLKRFESEDFIKAERIAFYKRVKYYPWVNQSGWYKSF